MKKITKLTLSLPPSINATYRAGGGHFYKSDKAKVWFDSVGFDAYAQWGKLELKCRVKLNIDWYFKRERDIDSGLKAILDVLTGIVYLDDKQVSEIHMTKDFDKKEPRVEILIEEYQELL